MEKTPIPINIHGYRSTPQFSDYESWTSHITEQLKEISNRISISDFLKRDQFIRNKRDDNPEPKRVQNMFDDPLPNGGGISSWKSQKDYPSNQQRREWGFREKVLQGYPEYEPDKIGYGDLEGKVIAGFVTVGDGIFSGIPSYSNISLDREETRRQIEYGYGRSTGRDMIPTGLSFIQDETGGIGLMLGSDVRYTWHPRLYGTNLSNPSIAMVDDMHMGSITVPKGDYRQFLRVGDFVIIEIGTRLKYWHSLLGGSRPDYWETLVGYGEVFDTIPTITKDVRGADGSWTKLNLGREDVDMILDGKTAEQTKAEMKSKYGVDNRGRAKAYRTIDPPKILGKEARFRDEPPSDSGQAIIDHPWSTGTPIPINSGMPYLMMEDYLVDSSDRVSPSAFVVRAKDLRDIRGKGENSGSILKGMLVKLQGLYFVEGVSEVDAIIATPTTQSTGLYGGGFKYAPMLTGFVRRYDFFSGDPIKFPTNTPTSNFINDNLKELGLTFWQDVPTDMWIRKYWLNNGQSTSPLPDENSPIFEFYRLAPPDIRTEVINSLRQGIIPDTIKGADASIVGFKPYGESYFDNPSGFDAWKHTVTPSYGVDYSGYKFHLPSKTLKMNTEGASLLNPVPASTVPARDALVPVASSDIVRDSDDRLQGGDVPKWPTSDIEPTYREGGDGNLYEIQSSFGSIILEQRIVPGSWQLQTSDSDSMKSRAGLLEYIVSTGSWRFPLSIDKKDGAYWFTNKNIPLTNAIESGHPEAESTWLVSSTKVPLYIRNDTNGIRTISDLNRGAANSAYDTYFRYENDYLGQTFRRITSGYFEPNKVYYLQEAETGIVIPIRINANTEIARFRVPIPTGLVNVTGIAWQYSMGTPGMEWEREQYIMQVWPRFLSDIEPVGANRGTTNIGGEVPIIDEPFTPPGGGEPPRRRLPDITKSVEPDTPLDPVYLDCETLRIWLDQWNSEREAYIAAANWPIVNTQGQDASGNPLFNIHRDPVTGREITLSRDPRQQQATLENVYPEYPCKGMRAGDERAVIIRNSVTGVSRTFYFTIGPNGECNCVKMQPGGGVPQTPTNGNITTTGGNINNSMNFGGVR